MTDNQISPLPLVSDIESVPVLKKVASAHRFLAELKGIADTIPNELILINTLALQEAKDSSAVENIVTTHDELFKVQLFAELVQSPAAKEVSRYALALKQGYALVRDTGMLTNNDILSIHKTLEPNDAGFRKLPGTKLQNPDTAETVYIPPQDPGQIADLMQNLERYINDDSISTVDPLIKMVIIHHQFESIHPFYDGNGRTGRIINILYLVQQDLLRIPILYLSRYIIQNKSDYYRLLQAVRTDNNWEPWILFMLEGVEKTSQQTILIIERIRAMMMKYKHLIRTELPKIYSQELLNNIFRHPYTKIDFLKVDLDISRQTASRYLDQLSKARFLEKLKIGRSNYFVNAPLMELLMNPPNLPE